MTSARNPAHPIADLFVNRWSPRSFTEEAISDADMMTIFEAARWAPSSYNGQPWRFVYARRDTPAWPSFLSVLIDFNKMWAQKAAALILIAGKTQMTVNGAEQPSTTYAFDSGAAWSNLAHQASLMGWHTHGMVGFDRDAAKEKFHLPQGIEPLAMIAVGRIGPAEALPEAIRAREFPSDRLPLKEIVFEGAYPTA